MKTHQKLILALVILIVVVGGVSVWKIKSSQLKDLATVSQELPSAAKAVAAEQDQQHRSKPPMPPLPLVKGGASSVT